jgi:hypothetical protein
MKQAIHIKDLNGFKGHAALYRLDPIHQHENWCDETIDQIEYVIASGCFAFTDIECLLFPATKQGEITDWGEIGGLRGTTSHQDAFDTIGYTIVHPLDHVPTEKIEHQVKETGEI